LLSGKSKKSRKFWNWLEHQLLVCTDDVIVLGKT